MGELGDAAKPALDSLKRALQDPSVSVRAAAREAIEKIQSNKGEDKKDDDDDDDKPAKPRE